MQPLSIALAALRYAARGWSVVPIRGGGKLPLVPWQVYQYRRAEPDEIRSWFGHWPEANIAVVTGAISGIVVLDIDPRHGGTRSLAEHEPPHGGAAGTVEAVTGGGGRHLYFAHPGGVVRNQVALAPGIDLRGDGGYVVAPPSIHPNGARYVWLPRQGPGEIPLASLPAWLSRHTRTPRGGHSLAYWRHLLTEGVSEGERNNTIASITGHLLWHGVDPTVALELLLCWNRVSCRPPLSDEEVVRAVESITRLHQRGGGPGGAP